MNFLADLHIHSKYSLAASRNLDIENLFIAARTKGITVLGTGDFTHPGWLSEIKEKLIPAENGLYSLKKSISKKIERFIPESCRGKVRFILSCEVSNIFKKNGKAKKIHSIILLPETDSVEKLNLILRKTAKTESTGRPVLNLDVKELLEILLDISDKAVLIPAHIWTPWYSLFGDKSGFDSIEECFGKLSGNIYAVETGLSSDPAMCRMVSGLDKKTLISNSDAHSPLKIGREANIFNTALSYDSIISAIKSGNTETFAGTIEYYPEEGKYYADGHRNCKYSQMPEESFKNGGICPVCGKEVTKGVLHRILELSDRLDYKPDERINYKTIPLIEILSEIYQMNPSAEKISACYKHLLAKLGPELRILNFIDIGELTDSGVPLLAEAIKRMRRNKVKIAPGFDGEYGTIEIFSRDEIRMADIKHIAVRNSRLYGI